MLLLVLALTATVGAQDLLPADLYVLLNDGRVERFRTEGGAPMVLTPDDAFVIDFAVDALGERLAYRTASGLFTLDLPPDDRPVGSARLIDAEADVPPYRGRGASIAWTPSGDGVAYTTQRGARIYFDTADGPQFTSVTEGVFFDLRWSPGGRFLLARAEQDVWWVYRRDGLQLPLTSIISTATGAAWVSDHEIVFAPPTGGLRLMDLDLANAQSVLLDESIEYRLPTLDSDDALRFFARAPADPEVPPDSGRLLRLGRGQQQIEVIGELPIALTGLRWDPSGELLIALQGGAIALLNPLTGEAFTLPASSAVAYSWGPLPQALLPTPELPATAIAAAPEILATPTLDLLPTPTPGPISAVTGLPLPTDLFFLAPDSNGVQQIWRMPANGASPLQLTVGGGDVNEFAIAPDGLQVVYVSDAQLWIEPVNAGGLRQLAELNSFAPANPTFSPDGTQIAYVDEGAPNGGIWIVPAAGGDPERVLANEAADPASGDFRVYRRPQFAPDGDRLLVDIYFAAGVQMGILDLATATVTDIPVAEVGDIRPLTARWLSDGRILTHSDATAPLPIAPGLYLYDAVAPATTAVEGLPLGAGVIIRSVREIAPGRLRIVLADGQEAVVLRVIDLVGREPQRVREIEVLIAPRLSPNGSRLAGYTSLIDIEGVRQGPLLFVDLATGERFLLSQPPTVWGIAWGR
ncbi:MAG: hypothetical protein GYB67_09395 [Chloroflexi bacterium]|nr:hypothetical protein [Chloroflexota bacterium]